MIIGIAGKARAGKDTLAKYLVEKGFTPISFADPLKRYTAYSFNLKLEEFYNEIKDQDYKKPFVISENGLNGFLDCLKSSFLIKPEVRQEVLTFSGRTVNSHRELLQLLGTEIARNLIDPEIWIKIFKTKAVNTDNIVVADARYENERSTITELNGINVLIKRPNVEIKNSFHSSENSLGHETDYNIILNNNDTIQTLYRRFEDEIYLFQERKDVRTSL